MKRLAAAGLSVLALTTGCDSQQSKEQDREKAQEREAVINLVHESALILLMDGCTDQSAKKIDDLIASRPVDKSRVYTEKIDETSSTTVKNGDFSVHIEYEKFNHRVTSMWTKSIYPDDTVDWCKNM